MNGFVSRIKESLRNKKKTEEKKEKPYAYRQTVRMLSHLIYANTFENNLIEKEKKIFNNNVYYIILYREYRVEYRIYLLK